MERAFVYQLYNLLWRSTKLWQKFAFSFLNNGKAFRFYDFHISEPIRLTELDRFRHLSHQFTVCAIRQYTLYIIFVMLQMCSLWYDHAREIYIYGSRRLFWQALIWMSRKKSPLHFKTEGAAFVTIKKKPSFLLNLMTLGRTRGLFWIPRKRLLQFFICNSHFV